MTIEKTNVGYTLTHKRHNGSSLLHGKDRMSLITSMLDSLSEEKDEMEREQNHKYEEDHKNGLI